MLPRELAGEVARVVIDQRPLGRQFVSVNDDLNMQHIQVTIRVLIETGTGDDGDGFARCTHTQLHVIVVVECVRKQRRDPNFAACILHRSPKTVRLVEVCSSGS